MKRFWLLPILLLLAAAALLATHSVASPQTADAIAPVSVFFVRHAETAASTRTNRDPELSKLGLARGKALAQLLRNSGATHLFASEFVRTQGTLKALAEICELEIKVIAAADAATQLANLRSLPPGSVAIVCGHSNTVPAMVSGLGGKIAEFEDIPVAKQVLEHNTYHRLFLVVLPAVEGTAPKAIEFQFGAGAAQKHDD